jgi:hypothetical protein
MLWGGTWERGVWEDTASVDIGVLVYSEHSLDV